MDTKGNEAEFGQRRGYSLWVHKSVGTDSASIQRLHNEVTPEKVIWAQRLLALDGRTPTIKGIVGQACAWRRTPVKGNHYYMWWLPSGVAGSELLSRQVTDRQTAFLRAIRHHDDTKPLEPGDLSDYEQIPISALDPLSVEQHKVLEFRQDGKAALNIVSGQPGSGKTVALQYAALRLRTGSEERPVLYVTYTKGLADQARDVFRCYGALNEIRVMTLANLECDILGPSSAISRDDQGQLDLGALYKRRPKPTIGAWQEHQDLLWTEIRAYLLGMALPEDWKRQGYGTVKAGTILDQKTYLKLRGELVGRDEARHAHAVAAALVKNPELLATHFGEQLAARQALDILRTREIASAGWLNRVRAVVVDEVQDLTLVQIALLAEVGRQALRAGDALSFVIAGDESQTVHPSGFDWAVTKDFLRVVLQAKPEDRKLSSQLRCPDDVAKLVAGSWQLYKAYLPDQEYFPKQGSTDEAPKEDGMRSLLWWVPTKDTDWSCVLRQIGKYTSLAIVDLEVSNLESVTGQLPEDCRTILHELVYSPEQAKGLDRKTVLLVGLDAAIDVLNKRKQQFDHPDRCMAALANRELIDQIRVGLSRSTETLVVVTDPGFSKEHVLDMLNVESVGWDEVYRHLREQYADIGVLEQINDLLYTAQESLRRGELDRASQMHGRARKLLAEIEDPDIVRQVNDLRLEIDRETARNMLEDVKGALNRGDLEATEQCLGQLRDLLQKVPDQTLEVRYNELVTQLDEERVGRQLTTIREALQSGDMATATQGHSLLARMPGLKTKIEFREVSDQLGRELGIWQQTEQVRLFVVQNDLVKGYRLYKSEIEPDCAAITYSTIQRAIEHISTQLKSRHIDLAAELWNDCKAARTAQRYHEASNLYGLFAKLREEQNERAKAEQLQCLSERYGKAAPPVKTASELEYLVKAAARFVPSVGIKDTTPREIAVEWMRDICEAFAEVPSGVRVHRAALESLLALPLFRDAGELRNAVGETLEKTVTRMRQAGHPFEAIDLVELFSKVATSGSHEQLLPLQPAIMFMDNLRMLYPAERYAVLAAIQKRVEKLNVDIEALDSPAQTVEAGEGLRVPASVLMQNEE